jgi:hypothetical protein
MGVPVKRLETLGSPRKRTEFFYSGSLQTGVVLQQSGNPKVNADVFTEALKHFAGKRVYGGFSEDNPRPGGFCDWLQKESPRLNTSRLMKK